MRSWASGLDRATYEARQAEGGIYVQSTPPDDVAAALRHNGEELERAGEATRLMVRYHIEPRKGTALPLSAEDLAADLAVAEQLLDSPPELQPRRPVGRASGRRRYGAAKPASSPARNCPPKPCALPPRP